MGEAETQNLAYQQIQRPWMLSFVNVCTFWRLQFIISTKFRVSKRAKMTVLDFLHTPKLISKKIFAQFYVKSIFADFRNSKTVILTILESLNFELCQKFKVQELLKLSMSKWQCLELKNYQNWFHIKSEWQRNSENFHTVFTCWIIFIFRSSGRIILIHKLDPTFFVSHFKSFVTSLNFFFWG